MQAKTIPYISLQEYLQAHKAINSLLELEKDGIMTKETIEQHLPSIFKKIHECVTKIMKE